MACNESKIVNVGDPNKSQMERSIGERDSKPRTPRNLLGSQMRHSTDKTSNDRGGKDAG